MVWRYGDILFQHHWNKIFWLLVWKQALLFKNWPEFWERIFLNQNYIIKKDHFSSCWGKYLSLLIFSLFLDLTTKLKEIHIHLLLSLLSLLSHLQLLKGINAFIQQCITAFPQHPCFWCAKRGLPKWSFFCAPKHGGTLGMCHHGWLIGPGTGHGNSYPPHGHLQAPLHLGLPPPGLCPYQGSI